MTKRENYTNRVFVWLDDISILDNYPHEHDLCKNYFAMRSFTYKQCIELMQNVIRMRPNYPHQKDWSRLEAGHRFKTLLNMGIIRELK